MNKLFIGIIIVFVVIGGFIFMSGKQTAEAPTTDNQMIKKEEVPVVEEQEKVAVKETVVKITKAGFVPNQVTIKAGEAIRFQNESGAASWPASAMHPTHTVYPGSDIKKCDTPEEPNIFDACRGLADGETWSFVFTQKGSWKYHDHVVSGRFGSITVE
jgi:plastocyanin